METLGGFFRIKPDSNKGVRPQINNIVWNLSTTHHLTEQQQTLLNRDLSFIPTKTLLKNKRQDLAINLKKLSQETETSVIFWPGNDNPPKNVLKPLKMGTPTGPIVNRNTGTNFPGWETHDGSEKPKRKTKPSTRGRISLERTDGIKKHSH